jgi:hypothetical protein
VLRGRIVGVRWSAEVACEVNDHSCFVAAAAVVDSVLGSLHSRLHIAVEEEGLAMGE